MNNIFLSLLNDNIIGRKIFCDIGVAEVMWNEFE